MNNDPAPRRILVVEDEPDMARVLQFNLTRQGHEVAHAGRLAAAGEQVANGVFDLILLDLRLPDGSGLDFLRSLDNPPPVIVVSALGDEATVVEALHLGAEDFVAKPFRIRELLARVAGTLRRHAAAVAPAAEADEDRLCDGKILLNLATREVEVDGELVKFTRSEFRLLLHFLQNPDRVLTRKLLCDDALEAGGSVQERTIDAHVRTIRRKLGDQGQRIATVWGVGYRFVAPEAAE
ncbi:MAG: response regulator transcription factor [Victivallales bacterium]|nr:response regulator transcription factor [Victivallales bacterium]